MATLASESGSVIVAEPGAHHWRFVGVEIRPVRGKFLYNLVDLGSNATSLDDVPHHFAFERCYVHGDRAAGSRRGIALNSAFTTVADSWFTDFKEVGADTQALAGWNGPGPFVITNNRLEAAGENVMFGGADPKIRDLVPSDIDIVGNDLAKPARWRQGHAEFEGKTWQVKNLLELKNARRVRIVGNRLEHNWAQSQNGFAILFTVRNQDGKAPWSTVQDVTFADNVVRDVANGVNILAVDDAGACVRAADIRIEGNLFLDVDGTLFQLLEGAERVVIRRNTAFHAGRIAMAEGAPHAGFVFEGNLIVHDGPGFVGSGTAPGPATLAHYFPGARVEGNVIVSERSARARALAGSDGWPRVAPGSELAGVGADLDALRAELGSRP
jgi:hypothetical protein